MSEKTCPECGRGWHYSQGVCPVCGYDMHRLLAAGAEPEPAPVLPPTRFDAWMSLVGHALMAFWLGGRGLRFLATSASESDEGRSGGLWLGVALIAVALAGGIAGVFRLRKALRELGGRQVRS